MSNDHCDKCGHNYEDDDMRVILAKTRIEKNNTPIKSRSKEWSLCLRCYNQTVKFLSRETEGGSK